MSELYEPIEQKLEPYFECQLDQIPEELRNWLLNEFFFEIWDELSADQRKSVASQYDYQHDPQYEAEREFDFKVACRRFELQEEYEKLEKMEPQSITEHELKRTRMDGIIEEVNSLSGSHPLKETPNERAMRFYYLYRKLGSQEKVGKAEKLTRARAGQLIKKGEKLIKSNKTSNI